MRVGLIARADERGLGHISREFFRAMNPAKTLVVLPERDTRHEQHREWYPATAANAVSFVRWTDQFPEANMRQWLDGLDLVYTAETFYDWRTVRWASEAGVATVLHANPEFYTPDLVARFPPTAVWNQSTWRHKTLRSDAAVVPVPVATDRFSPTPRGSGPLRVLHVVGANAGSDRNGTPAFLNSLFHVEHPVDVTLVTQRKPPTIPKVGPNVRVRYAVVSGDYWTMYSGHDVLVLPRRFAGQSLPTQEAMAAGLAVVMTDCPPNDMWPPVVLAPAAETGKLDTPGGKVPLFDVCPWSLGGIIDELAVDSPRLVELKAAGLEWARQNSWTTLAPKYREAFQALTG